VEETIDEQRREKPAVSAGARENGWSPHSLSCGPSGTAWSRVMESEIKSWCYGARISCAVVHLVDGTVGGVSLNIGGCIFPSVDTLKCQ